MSAERPPRALSGGPLGAETPGHSPEEGPRYADAGQLGQGGMGEVRAAWDARLEREVALKMAHPGQPGLRARLEREAALTARLEHPGIVPVYDAGTAPDGRPFYAMRLMRGRSLEDALREAPDLEARLRLVRRVLDVAQAVAYAHGQGVVHRDLKPANVMLGEHGETVVTDWGLAGDLVDAIEITENRTSETRPTLTAEGAVLGTPAYMAPEQARGEPADARSDVFALGGVLFAVLSGQAPKEHEGAAARRSREVCPEAPSELAAIADRALQADPARRYPDAAALAADLESWFEGRRVQAYAYTPLELLGRVARAWRVPLIAAGLATLGVLIATVVGVERTLTERSRAQQAEAEALAAKSEADAHLAQALVAQAVVAARAGDRGPAELLATRALLHGEDPVARGILAGFAGAPRPERALRRPLPGCARVFPDPSGRRLACVNSHAVSVIEPALGGKPRLERALEEVWGAAFDGEGRWLVLVNAEGVLAWDLETDALRIIAGEPEGTVLRDGARPGEVLRFARGKLARLAVSGAPEQPLPRCPSGGAALRSVEGPDGSLWMACAGRGALPSALARVDPDGALRTLIELPVEEGPPSSLSLHGAERVALGSEGGALYLWEAGAARRVGTEAPGVFDLALQGDTLAVAGSQGGVALWDLSAGEVFARLPSRLAQLRWQGDTLRVIDDEVSDWRVPPPTHPHRLRADSGVAAAALSPDGRRLASAHGDGTLRVHDLETGALLWSTALHASVAKDVVFTEDGCCVVGGTALGEEVVWLDRDTGERLRAAPIWRTRRLVSRGDTLFVAAYDSALDGVGPDGQRRSWPVGTQVSDLEPVVDGPELVVMENRGRIWRLDPGAAPGPPARSVGIGAAVAVAGDAEHTWVALPRAALMLDAELQERRRLELSGAHVMEIALSPDRRWLAVGHRDGAVTLWDTDSGALRASLQGHSGRVVALEFSGDGATLVSGSWDGDLRVWDLTALTAAPEALLGPIERAWDLDLSRALAR
ncbi:MAG: protein kinase [Alphaproteobacteria bacterium]|nr:protein kinase [Alphaproteobacteria bacterium]